jgi:hypothetical protein
LDTTTPQVSVLAGGNDLNGGGVLGDQGGDDHFLQRFALGGHGGYAPASAMKFALEHQNPLVAGRVDGGDVYPEQAYSLLSLENPNVLLWALKPADDGLEAGLVTRVWNLSNEASEFFLSVDGGVNGALSLTHIETPTGIGTVRDGRLVHTIRTQQIETYSIFPSQLPFSPDTSGLEPDTATPVVVEPTSTTENMTSTPDVAKETPTPSVTPGGDSSQVGEGCLPALLTMLGFLKT